jgi:hypothetical protein
MLQNKVERVCGWIRIKFEKEKIIYINFVMVVFKAFHGGIQTFDPKGEPTSIAPSWRRWKRGFELFVVFVVKL